MKKYKTLSVILLVAFLVIVGFILALNQAIITMPTAAPSAVSADSIKISSVTAGQYLVDGRGMTLYYFTKDATGKSNCAGACIALWPAFYADALAVSAPLQKGDFTSVTRADGVKQLAYKGQPLYYYAKDTKVGDTIGDGFNNFWFLVKP